MYYDIIVKLSFYHFILLLKSRKQILYLSVFDVIIYLFTVFVIM